MPLGPDQGDGHSALVVPVPALEAFVRARHEHYDPAYVSADPTFAHSHITLLAPLLGPEDLAERADEIAEILSAATPFTFTLARIGTFPNGIIHLVPAPAGPFAELTRALVAAFPAYQPYGGQFGMVTPHLTLDAVGPGVSEALVWEWVAPLLPATGYAGRAHLSWYQAGACRTLASWEIGSGHDSIGG